ncbi:MAG: hypothetical protein PHG66_01335 [Candidatus Colwellbacteria bacterium]|nr:hypothetical protein [Candidatus Colwellbacteria bacterium]
MDIRPLITHAADIGVVKSINDFLPGGVSNLLNLGLGLGAILAFGTIIYAGILYTVSGDDSSKQKEAKAWIWAAAQGLALLALGFIVFNVINPNVVKIKDPDVTQLNYPETDSNRSTTHESSSGETHGGGGGSF